MLPINIGTPNNGRSVLTAGGLIIVAAAAGNLIRAIDIYNGETLWHGVPPAGSQATPMVYEEAGRQYLGAVAAGHPFMETPEGDYVVAYAVTSHGFRLHSICGHALFVDRMYLLGLAFLRSRSKSSVELGDITQILFVEILDADHAIARLFGSCKQLVQLQMHCNAVLVLALLNQKHHQERDDGGTGIDDELPVLGILEDMSKRSPQGH